MICGRVNPFGCRCCCCNRNSCCCCSGRCGRDGNRCRFGCGGTGSICGIFSGQLCGSGLCSFLRCLAGLALSDPLPGAGCGLLLTLLGAALDAADRADALGAVRCDGLAAVGTEGLAAFVDAHRAEGGELAELHAVDAAVGAGRDADAALTALPGRDDDAGLAVGQVFQFERAGAAGFFALAAAEALLGEVRQIPAVAQRRLGSSLELLCPLVEHEAEVGGAVLLAAQAGQHLQQLLGAGAGALRHVGEHLPAAQLLYMVGRFVLLIGQRDPALEELGAEELHQTGQLFAELGGADVVLALTAGGQVKDQLLVQSQIGQRFPREGGDAGADGGVLAGALLAAQPEGVVVGISQRGVPLYLLRRRDDAARAAGGHAEAAVGAGSQSLTRLGRVKMASP